ncbi:MAG: RsmB/NOP family class I SAM-dependent RNA methyltransferase [Calditrichaceae bacterium]|nr:RsmB/NOP family class I SAM-dependent RNA methyltransferase [Calditrichaceae bacterium]
MAAAPGSKSTQMAAMMKNSGRLYLNDINRARLQPLNTNLQRCGVINQIVLNLPGERIGMLMPDFFDRILLDAPCTALGSMHQNKEIDLWWSMDKLERLCALQYRLLISAFKALKTGGLLVYSTCSITEEENERNIEQLIRQYPVQVESIIEIDKNGFEQGKSNICTEAIRVYPHKQQMEGFFVVKLRKISKKKYIIDRKKTEFIQTLSYADKELFPELEEISRVWGIPFSVWKNYRYVLTNKRIWLLCPDISDIPKTGLISSGLLLAEHKSNSWKLLNQSVQFLARYITKTIEPDDNLLKTLFAKSVAYISGVDNGYYALCRSGKPFASVNALKGRLKIRLQQAYTLPELKADQS